MSAHIHEQGALVQHSYNNEWRCKHCPLQRSPSYWQRYRANLKQIMGAIIANGLPDHEERVRAVMEHFWREMAERGATGEEVVRYVVGAYLAWQEEEPHVPNP